MVIVNMGTRYACGTLLFVLLIGMFLFVDATFAAPKKVGGWAWNPTLGWIRQRDAIVNTTSQDRKGAFGVQAGDPVGRSSGPRRLTGWSWSSIGGWICWGSTCQNFPGASDRLQYGRKDPPNNTEAQVNNDGSVHGWIKVLKYKDHGWISLSKLTSGGTVDYGVRYDDARREFSGWAWGGSKLGWIVFSGKTLYDTEYIPPGANQRQKACIDPKETDPAKRDKCLVSVDTSDPSAPKSKWFTQFIGAWLQARGGSIASKGGFEGQDLPPELLKNSEFLILSGIKDNAPAPISNFVSTCEEAGISRQTCRSFGVVHDRSERKKSGALSRPPAKRVEIVTRRERRRSVDREIRHQEIKSKRAELNLNALRLISNLNNLAGIRKNEYGLRVHNLLSNDQTDDTLQLIFARPASGGGVYYFSGGATDLDIKKNGTSATGEWTVAGSVVSDRPGARTVVVEGDLIIRRGIEYERARVPFLQALPSIAWVVIKRADGTGGNIIFDDCIPPTDFQRFAAVVSGIFFAEGRIETGTGEASVCKNSSEFSEYATFLENRRRQVSDRLVRCRAELAALPQGSPQREAKEQECRLIASDEKRMEDRVNMIKNPPVDIPLVVKGMMIALEFRLERKYGGADMGAETLVDDGRYFVSVPPGLEDFLKSLPSF